MAMKAVIMAGGEGRRLKSVTGELPKPMVPLIGKPLMERVIELLRKHGVTDIAATLRYNPAPILAHFGDGSRLGVRLHWFIEQEPLGTAGSVKNCASFTGSEDILVLSGDAACDFDLTALMREHRRGGAAVTIALRECRDPLRYGLVVPDAKGDVRCFIEKPGWQKVVTDLVNTGIYAVSPRAMELVPEGREFDFARDLFPLLLERGEGVRGVKMEGYWCDVGSPLSYYRCCADALEGKLRLDFPELFRPPIPSGGDVPPLPGENLDCACRSRAELMGSLSELLMDMGADYSDGLQLDAPRFHLRISPLASRSALRISVSSQDAEFARELAISARDLARALEKGGETG